MPDPTRQAPRPEQLLSYFEKLVGDLDQFAAKLPAAPPPLLQGLESFGGPPAAPAAERERLRADGREALAKARRGEPLTPAQQLGFEAIVALEARPALLVRHGAFEPPPAEWSILERHRAAIHAALPSVGRIEVSGHPDLDWVGTGFLAAPDVVMTNEHVATEFCQRSTSAWVFRAGMTSRVDFVREEGSTKTFELAVREVLDVRDDHDLALLRVEPRSATGAPAPQPLKIGSVPMHSGRRVYVVGYPASDGERNVPAEMRRIFADVYDVKRLQPGRTRPFLDGSHALEHDCSTLGGNSGSPVIDLETHRVVGLHFAGEYLRSNYAVPLWTLAADAGLRAARVSFV